MQVEKSNVVITPITVEEIFESYEDKSVSINTRASKWELVKAAQRRILPRPSIGEIKLNNLIDELQKFAIEDQEEVRKNEEISVKNYWNCMRLNRQYLIHILQKTAFHYIIISLVIIDLIVVLIDLVLGQLSAPCLTDEEMNYYNTTKQRETCLLEYSIYLTHADIFLFYFSVLLLTLFVLEVFLSFYAFGWKYYKNPLYLLDASIVLASFIMELYFHSGSIGKAGRAASAIIILRLWKIIRAIHAVAHSITLKNRLLIKKIQEAKILLEEEKEQTEQTLERQEIKLDYFANILISLEKLPSTKQIDNYIKNIQIQRKQLS